MILHPCFCRYPEGDTMRIPRQNKILELIENYEIETQDKLASMLKSFGYEVTQATISRDIKELHSRKNPFLFREV